MPDTRQSDARSRTALRSNCGVWTLVVMLKLCRRSESHGPRSKSGLFGSEVARIHVRCGAALRGQARALRQRVVEARGDAVRAPPVEAQHQPVVLLVADGDVLVHHSQEAARRVVLHRQHAAQVHVAAAPAAVLEQLAKNWGPVLVCSVQEPGMYTDGFSDRTFHSRSE